jgi:hypothetical protein
LHRSFPCPVLPACRCYRPSATSVQLVVETASRQLPPSPSYLHHACRCHILCCCSVGSCYMLWHRARSGHSAHHVLTDDNSSAGKQAVACCASAHGRLVRESCYRPVGPTAPLFCCAAGSTLLWYVPDSSAHFCLLASRNHMALRLVVVQVTLTCLPLLVPHASHGVSRPAWPLPWASLTTPPSAVCGRHAWAFIGGRPAVSKTEGRAGTALRLLPEETAGDGTQVGPLRCAEACT